MSRKTKKLIKYILKNKNITEFYEADLKENVKKSGRILNCINCDYEYYSDNHKCPNCGISTKENL